MPPSSGDVVIANDINIDQNTNTLGTVTINPGVTLTVNSSRTMTATGLTLANGTLSVSGTYDADGAFDATSGTVTIGAGGLLALGDAVPSLGTFTAQASNSTVRYDQSSGGPQVIPVNAKGAQGEYETLEINGVNKELTGNTQVNTALNFEASGTVKLDLNGNDLTIFASTNNDNAIVTYTMVLLVGLLSFPLQRELMRLFLWAQLQVVGEE